MDWLDSNGREGAKMKEREKFGHLYQTLGFKSFIRSYSRAGILAIQEIMQAGLQGIGQAKLLETV
jgi:hypothetical protein